MKNKNPNTSGLRKYNEKISKEKRDQYALNPNLCKYCNKPILLLNNQKLAEIRSKRFCNHSCSANYYNNKNKIKIYYCNSCQEQLEKPGSKCNSCKRILKKFNKKIEDVTLTEIQYKGKNRSNAFGLVRHHSRKILLKYSTKHCNVCGYTNHVEVAHIKPISSFPEETTLNIVNHIDNLALLCPNHHWELDHNMITPSDFKFKNKLITSIGIAPIISSL